MRIFTSLCLFFTCIGLANAQVPRFVLVEHFTNTACGPCASINPLFDANIIKPNEQIVRHIAYHPWWPTNQDPFYLYDVDMNTKRTQLYSVAGVPDAVVNGNFLQGNPSGISQTVVNSAWAKSSPLKVSASWEDQGDTREIKVSLKSFGAVPDGDWKLHVVVVERNINWTTPAPNGEKYFNDVPRKMFPDYNGTSITLPALGADADTYTFTYTEDPALQQDELAVIAFVQNASTKEVLNTGASYDVPLNIGFTAPAKFVGAGTKGQTWSAAVNISNTGDADEKFKFTLVSDQPADWSSQIVINGVAAGQESERVFASGESLDVYVEVTPGEKPYVGKYSLEIVSLDNPGGAVLRSTLHVISGVSDLVINNSSALGGGTGSPADWKGLFDTGLNSAGNTSFAHSDELVFQGAVDNDALAGVKNVYFNGGWSFPTLTPTFSTALKAFSEAGGNIYMGGQDIAWASFDTDAGNTYDNPEAQALLRENFGVDYANDGASTDKTLTSVSSELFGGVAQSTLNAYYGANYFFPDNLKVYGTGKVIFNYNASASKVAGIRNETETYKTVYIAPGVEMMTPAVAQQVLKLTHDYFYGLILSTEYDQAVAALMNNYPNPARDFTQIPVIESAQAQTLILSDLQGKVLRQVQIPAHSTLYTLETGDVPAGQYFYQFKQGKDVSVARKLQVVH